MTAVSTMGVPKLPAVIETVDQALVMLERAAAALDDAVHFQEVRKVSTTAVAAAAFAREAKDDRLLSRATELRSRAERRAGQMLAKAAEKGERDPGGRNRRIESSATTQLPTLAAIGVTKDQSSKWQQVAALSDKEFERALATTKAVTNEISTPKILRAVQQSRSREPEVIEADEEPAPIVAKTPTHADQAMTFYNAVRALGEMTCTARQLRAALPEYQHFRITENVGRALALLKEVERTWTT